MKTGTEQLAVYQGQFGEFIITPNDRTEVIIYRLGLCLAAFNFAIATLLVLIVGEQPWVLNLLSLLFVMFSVGLGISLATIHIYLRPLHRLLQVFWMIGTITALIIAWRSSDPLALFVYNHPSTLFGIGFTFAALTGIFFKEAFCFNRLETKFLTLLVPSLLLGHLTGILPVRIKAVFLASWGLLFIIFGFRKAIQAIPPDIGDKSVFTYLEQQRSISSSS
ncbi:MAG: DUF2301 domain-containing membrane protein [cyanobacterium endosymbiont of Rhopalodia musculus]|uniref:DUF2301 domain-containing membrane protein n=1 Tax=cyanobacterium endosymbiont of Epithemia clementina EcSB TaxID=3034674 RepID=UPI002480E692|nr:DUF2301 domain-containing membrane protein [cyanobacterium endosymbiont of Epithemia clementina EcSB]WGT67906.1 DUF2301 domain-containing membrane protein [cyanobacterium endosymbiont of Epithemia clementina EcSB]